MPFKEITWTARTSPPGLINQVGFGHVSGDGKTWIGTQSGAFGASNEIPLMDYFFADMAYSGDQATTWIYQSPLTQTALCAPVWSIPVPGTPTGYWYFRMRFKFSRSFFVANNSIG